MIKIQTKQIFSLRQHILEIIVLVLIYNITARISQVLAILPGNITPVWIPSGIIFAAVLIRGYYIWPGIFIGSLLGNSWAYFDVNSWSRILALLFAGTANGIGDVLCAVLSAYLFEKTTGTRNPLYRSKDFIRFITYGVLLGPAISAFFGVTSLCIAGFTHWNRYFYSFLTWWIGDGMGVLIITPLIIAWVINKKRVSFTGEFYAFILILLITCFHCLGFLPILGAMSLHLYAIVPIFIWSIFRLHLLATITSVFIVAVIIVIATTLGYGTFAGKGLNESLISLQLFLAVFTISIFVLNAVVIERQSISETLQLSKQELRISKDFYETVLDNMSDAVCIINVKDLSIININKVFCNKFGMKKEEAIGKTCYEVMHQQHDKCSHSEYLCPFSTTLRTGKFTVSEHTHYLADGSEIYVSIAASPIKDKNGEIVQIIHVERDITQRKRAEKNLELERNKLKDIIENMADGVYIVNQKYDIEYINPIIKREFGEVNGRKCYEYFYDRNEVCHWCKNEEVLSGKSVRWQWYSEKNKKYYDLFDTPIRNADGTVSKFVIFHDITQLKLAEQAIKRAQQYAEDIINTMRDPLLVLDDHFKVISANKSFYQLFKTSLEEITGKSIFELGSQQFNTPSLHVLLKKVSEMKTYFDDVEITYKKEDLGERIMIISARRIISGARDTRLIRLTFEDITDHILNERLRASLREKEMLIKEVHHRVKNNMQIISSMLRLTSKYEQDRNISKIIDESRDRIASMAFIHERLYQSEDFTRVDFSGYIKSLANNLLQTYLTNPERIDLMIEIDNVSLGIDTAIPLGLIVNELLTNSIKHAFPQERENQQIRISLISLKIFNNGSDREYELIVSDNGIGIPEEVDLSEYSTIGYYIINSLSKRKLCGKLKINRNKGTEVRLRFKELKKNEKALRL